MKNSELISILQKYPANYEIKIDFRKRHNKSLSEVDEVELGYYTDARTGERDPFLLLNA